MQKKPSLVQAFRLLRAGAKIQRMQRETETLLEEVREAEGANCGYCGTWRTWKLLTDESTQMEQRPLICVKCVERRKVAHGLGWNNWPKERTDD